MNTILSQLLNLIFILDVSVCAVQQRKVRLQERPKVVNLLLESRNFKVNFPIISQEAGGMDWSFLGAEVPFYMQISNDTLYSFMSYDIWSRPNLSYVFARPYKYGRPFPSQYVISNYEVKAGQKKSFIVSFRFDLPVNMRENKIVYPQPLTWFSNVWESTDKEKIYEMKLICVRCEMVVARNGDVSGQFIREDSGEKIFSLFRGYFDFNHSKSVYGVF